MNKNVFFVDVTETFKARIAVRAKSEDDAEIIADELVGGGIVSIVNLSKACCPESNYKKECKVIKMVCEHGGELEGTKVYG